VSVVQIRPWAPSDFRKAVAPTPLSRVLPMNVDKLLRRCFEGFAHAGTQAAIWILPSNLSAFPRGLKLRIAGRYARGALNGGLVNGIFNLNIK
jgi:hypothetical protein